MRHLKRQAHKAGRGAITGHSFGNQLIDYVSARRQIYLPSYTWVLENRMAAELSELRKFLLQRPLALLDYEVNDKVDDIAEPLSHASLIASYLQKDCAKYES